MSDRFVRGLIFYIVGFLVIVEVFGLADDVLYERSQGHGLFFAIIITLVWFINGGHFLGLRENIEAAIADYDNRQIAKRGLREPIFDLEPESEPLKAEHRPLPPELRYRVAVYLGRRQREDPKVLEREIHRAGSVNALVRAELKAGRM